MSNQVIREFMRRLFEKSPGFQALFCLFVVALFAACASDPDIEGEGTNNDNTASGGTGTSSVTYASSITGMKTKCTM